MNNNCCIALSFDRRMFYQAQACIDSIRRHCRYAADICVLALDLPTEQLDWLEDRGVKLNLDYTVLPRFRQFPLYAYSQICRPFLQDLFPGYHVYMWVDADIRFVRDDAFDAFLGQAVAHPETICICQEVEPAYICVHSAPHAKAYHEMKNVRIKNLYDAELLDKMASYYNFNTGIWGMHHASPVWEIFKKELMSVFSHNFDHMREQDALNVSLLRWGGEPVNLPATMNWLCALSLPQRDPDSDAFARPIYPHWPISVLHLIMSQSPVEVDGGKISFYQLYQRLGFTP
ncbi:MAG: hypothetical protein P8X55_19580 [Desulfosarcinaceae bacterium]